MIVEVINNFYYLLKKRNHLKILKNMIKKIFSIGFALSLILVFNACRDESLNPVPVFEPGVHGFCVFDGVAFNGNLNSRPQPYEKNYAKNFPLTGQDNAKLDFKVRWVSLDNKLTVNKIEIYVEMKEYYKDPEGNEKVASFGQKLINTIATPASNRQYNSFSITPTQVYNAFKDATVKYDKVKDTKVFANPANARPTGKWFNGTEDMIVTWRLYTSDGSVFKSWSPDGICGDVTSVSEANANCQLTFDVK
jgi:hypothetical protein